MNPSNLPPDDDGIEDLLRRVGGREEPSSAVKNEVYAATHAVWASVVTERARQHRRKAWSIAAGVAAVGIMAGALVLTNDRGSREAAAPVMVASVARVEGNLRVSGAPNQPVSHRAAGESVAAGELIETDAAARAALAFGSGVSVRLDHGTRIELQAQDRLRLLAGALYVDAPPPHRSALAIETATALVRHVGTQYLVSTSSDGITVGVREGRVLIEDNGTIHTGEPGEKIELSRDGQVKRTLLPAQHPEWQWANDIAPAFNVEGQTLAAFLEWVARESGRKLVYASEEARVAANQVRLRGSIERLDLNAALIAVLSTIQLRQFDSGDGAIGIEFAQTGAAPR